MRSRSGREGHKRQRSKVVRLGCDEYLFLLGSPYPANHSLSLVSCVFGSPNTPAALINAPGIFIDIVAFESSADDTAVAVVRSDRTVLSNVVIKQHAQCVSLRIKEVRALMCSHAQYGGIQPSVAISWHQRNLVRALSGHRPCPILRLNRLSFFQPFAVKQALEEAKTKAVDIDGIAFTRGPGEVIAGLKKMRSHRSVLGMGGCLAASNNAAKSLAAALGKPIVGVHHMVGLCASLIMLPLIFPSASACTHPSFNFRSSSTVSFLNVASIWRAYTRCPCEIASFLQTTFDDTRPRDRECLRPMFEAPQHTTRSTLRSRSGVRTVLSYYFDDATSDTKAEVSFPPPNLPTFM